MNTAHITKHKITLELEGTTYTEKISSIDEGRQRLVHLIQQHAAGDVEVAVHVSGEEPIGLAYRNGAFEQIPVPVTPAPQPVTQVKESEIPAGFFDEDEDEGLDMPLVEEKVIKADPQPQPVQKPVQEPVQVKSVRVPQPAADSPRPKASTAGTAKSKPSAEDFYSTKPEFTEPPAKNGWRGFLNSLGFSIPADAHELSERKARREIQRGLKSHKTIMVANLKGGAGKTTAAYLLSSVLGRVRGGTVLAWDNNENRGTLAYRSPIEPNTTNTAIDLLHEASFFANSGQSAELINFVRPQGENKFDLLASQHQGSDKPVINGEGFLSLHEILRSFYRMMIVDTGNASNASTWQAAAQAADELVIVCLNAEDSAQTAAETIDALNKKGYQHKVENSVAIVIDTKSGNDKKKNQAADERLGRIEKHLSSHVRAVHILPWDESLENGGAIEWERLSIKTQRALLETAASVVKGL